MYKVKELFNLDHTLSSGYLEKFTYPYEALSGIKAFIIELGNTLSLEEYNKVGDDIWISRSAKIAPSASVKKG